MVRDGSEGLEAGARWIARRDVDSGVDRRFKAKLETIKRREYKMKLTNTDARASAEREEGIVPDNTPLLSARSTELARNTGRG